MPATARSHGPILSAALLIALLAAPAEADITVLGAGGGLHGNSRLIFDANGDGSIGPGENIEAVPIAGSGSFTETSSLSLGGARISADQRSSVSSSGNLLAVSSSGSCEAVAPGSPLTSLAESNNDFRITFTVTERALYSISGTVSINAPSPNQAGVLTPLLQVGDQVGDPNNLHVFPSDLPLSANASVSDELEPGTYEVAAFCRSSAPLSQENPLPIGTARWRFTLTVEIPEAGDVFRWVGPVAGAFGTDTNWDPEGPLTAGVPAFVPGVRSDTALFRGGRARVDLAALAAASRAARGVAAQCAGPVSRSIGRLVLDRADLETVNGPLALDALSLDEPSLTLEDNGFLDLRETALCARHARIGAAGRPSLALVSGPGGVLQTLGRLSVGGGGEGTLRVQNGGIVSSEEVLLGDGQEQGSAVVSDATWQTGNIAVGFQSGGDLTIENAGLVESETAFVDRDLDPSGGDTAQATVRGANSTWRVNALFVGGRGTVRVEDGARIDAQPPVGLVDGVNVGSSSDPGEATLLVNDGGELRTQGLLVGHQGRGRLVVAETFDRNPLVDADFGLFIGGEGGGRGRVQVSGDPSTDGFSLVSEEFVIGADPGSNGELLIDFGGKALTSTNAFVGGEGGNGRVLVLGAALGSPEQITRWQISGGLFVGGPERPVTGTLLIRDAGVDVGTLSTPGTVVVQPGGAILGTGSQINLLRVAGGLITNDGLIAGPLTLDGRYDPASTGVILSTFAGLPPAPQQIAARSPAGAIAALGARRPKPPPPARGPVVFTGDAELGGTLVLQFLNGFAPSQGNAFEVVEAGGSVIGAFSELVVQGLAPGASFEETLQDGVLTLTSLSDATALPTVSLKAKTKLKEKKKKGGAVTFKRSGDTSQPMLVSYQVGGTATNGIDCELLPGVLEIPAGKKSAKLPIRPFRDGLPEADETIEIELVPGEDYAPSLASKVEIQLLGAE